MQKNPANVTSMHDIETYFVNPKTSIINKKLDIIKKTAELNNKKLEIMAELRKQQQVGKKKVLMDAIKNDKTILSDSDFEG
jgi:hypothetical protein